MSALLAQNSATAKLMRPTSGALSFGSGFDIRLLPPLDLEACAADMTSLASRAIERNAFYEAPFLIYAAHHLRDGGRPQIVSVWRDQQMVGLFPMVAPRFAATRTARGWLSHFMPLGVPLIDMVGAEDTLGAFLDWLAANDRLGAMLFPFVDAEGPFAALARSVALKRGASFAEIGGHERAVMRRGDADETIARLGPKKRKELDRQWRRLADAGDVSIRVATSRADVRNAFEHFLALEARGWKGRAGSAMMQDASAAAFARSAMRALAGEGRCRIELLELAGEPIAAAIEITAGDRAYFWKTAYDETHKRHSPGVQMAWRLTQRHQADKKFSLIDSCAAADHPMIDHLWSDRMRVADLVIGVSATHGKSVERIVSREQLRRRARTAAKQLYRIVRPEKTR